MQSLLQSLQDVRRNGMSYNGGKNPVEMIPAQILSQLERCEVVMTNGSYGGLEKNQHIPEYDMCVVAHFVLHAPRSSIF